MIDLFGHTLDDFIAEGRKIVQQAKARANPVKTLALFSGGDDSTTMLHMCRDLVDEVVHINTGIGIKRTTEYVRDVCETWRLKLNIFQTDPAVYRSIVLGHKGFPGPAFHYICYHRLKNQRLQEVQRDFSKRGELILFVSGVRAHESARRMKNIGALGAEIGSPRGRLQRCWWANPIVHFDTALMAEYRERYAVPQSPVAALIHKSGECLCGAFARPGELEEIEYWFPEDGAYIRSLEAEARKLGKQYCSWGHTKPTTRDVAPGPLCSSCQEVLPL